MHQFTPEQLVGMLLVNLKNTGESPPLTWSLLSQRHNRPDPQSSSARHVTSHTRAGLWQRRRTTNRRRRTA
eukprot:3740098-Rhodomonas_salina.1